MRDGSYYEFWVYILTSRTGTLYVGVTDYLGTRIMQHKIDSIWRRTHSRDASTPLIRSARSESLSMTSLRRSVKLRHLR